MICKTYHTKKYSGLSLHLTTSVKETFPTIFQKLKFIVSFQQEMVHYQNNILKIQHKKG